MNQSITEEQILGDNLNQVQTKIQQACLKSQRDFSEILLLAVSKTHTSEVIRKVFQLGQSQFGENYVQEVVNKQNELKDLNIHWHFIGHLQKNKVKNVVGRFDLIHSVDSLELAQKISTKATELNINQNILLEINIGSEDSKTGFDQGLLLQQWEQLLQLPNINICGLMALPPLKENPEDTRPYFRQIKTLFSQLKSKLPAGKQQLWIYISMGTTHDFPVAIEEGANIVRVGTAIFGDRPKKQ